MPNANYQRGRGKEYRVVERLRKQGYFSNRFAGSHGRFDVFGINPETREIQLVQCKPASAVLKSGELGKSWKETEEEIKSFEGTYKVIVSLETTQPYSKNKKVKK